MPKNNKQSNQTTQEESKEPKLEKAKEWVKINIRKLGLKKTVLVVVLVLVVSGFIYNYLDTKNKLSLLESNSSATTSQDNEIVQKIRKYFDLPNEEPEVKTVGDTSQLSKDEFFTRAKKGDKVIVFKQAKRAMLFRPSTGKVIEYTVVNL